MGRLKALLLCGLALVAGCARGAAQSTSRTVTPHVATAGATLTVDGFTGEVPIVQVHGHPYIDLEAFSRITNAAVRLQGSRLALTLPGQVPAQASAQPAATTDSAAPSASGFSRDFVASSVIAVNALREWRATLLNAVRNNFPVTDDLTASNRRNAEAQVALALAAAHNQADRNAATLMQNEVANMRTLNANLVGAHDSVTNIRTDAMDTDPLSVKTQSCLSALAGITVGGPFQDVSSCH